MPIFATVPTYQYNLFSDPLEDAVIAAFPQYEGSEIEYKSAKGGFPGSFWETYSAFANTEGGLIILGVKEDDDGRFKADGLPAKQIRKLQQDFFDTQNNRGKVSIDLLNDKQVRVLPVPDHVDQYVLVFDVPRANREQIPVYKGQDPFTGTYKRRDGGDYRCDRDAVRRMMSDSNANAPADSRILRGFQFPNDIDLKSLQQFRQLMASIRTGHPWLAKDDLELLKKLEAYRVDRQSKQEGLTLAGVLMFGKMEAIHDPECAPQFFPDYREVLTQDPEVRWTDRLYPDGTWEPNLFQFYLQVWPRISAGLPRPFQLKNGQRQDDTLAHIALREAFINSLVHADYSAPGSLVSIRRTNGFQFTNPGTLLVSIRQYYEGGVSVCRNKALQKMFSLIGGAEQAGSGADKIVKGWESAHWQRPYLEVQDQPDRVTLDLEMESILSGQARGRLYEAFGERATSLYSERLTILSIVAMEGSVTHRSLRYRVGMHAADLSGLLKALCQEDFLISTGWGSGKTYSLNDPKSLQLDNAQKVASSSEKVASFPEKVASFPEKVASFPEKVASPLPDLYVESISLKLQKSLLIVATNGWHTLAELAEATGKSSNYLRSKVIPALVSAGLLERRYEEPTHPNQAYRAMK
jgi:predicted HTH transcriptional regulator